MMTAKELLVEIVVPIARDAKGFGAKEHREAMNGIADMVKANKADLSTAIEAFVAIGNVSATRQSFEKQGIVPESNGKRSKSLLADLTA